ncbi:MAG: TSUP family transporter [Oscillospiraceae bacterium]
MVKNVLVALIIVLLALYALVLIFDLIKNRDRIKGEPGSPLLIAFTAPVIMFIATLGVSDFVMNTLFFKKCGLVDDKRLPGSLITSASLPLGAVAVVYLLTADIDIKIIAVCMIFQGVGAIIGVRLVAGFDGALIGKIVGTAMLFSAVFLLSRLIGIGTTGGTLTTFPLGKLIICGVCAFFLGIFNMMGMGAKAPYMSLLLTLGLSAECVLPVIMTACTMSAVSGAVQYVKRDLYQRKLAIIYSTFGFIGIALGFIFVTHLNQTALQVMMLLITVYTGVSMLMHKKRKAETV